MFKSCHDWFKVNTDVAAKWKPDNEVVGCHLSKIACE